MIIDMNYWNKVFRKIMILFITILGIYLSFKLAVFYMPFLVAFIISLLIEPVIRILMKRLKTPRKISAIIVFTIVLSIFIGLISWGIITIISEAANMLNGLNSFVGMLADQSQSLISKFNFNKFQLSDQINKILSNSANNFLSDLSNYLRTLLNKIVTTLTSIPTIGLYIIITILALYFICTDKIYMIDQLEHHFPEKWVKKIGYYTRKIIKSLGCYLKAEIILVLISFVISIVGLYIFKFIGFNIQYPLMAALGIGFVDALPIFGSGTIMVPWAIVSATNGDYRLGVAILSLWGLMSIIRQLIEPKIVSKQIGIHPIFTLIAMYTGFKISGLLGLFIGPIVLIVLKNIFATTIDKGFIKSIFEREI